MSAGGVGHDASLKKVDQMIRFMIQTLTLLLVTFAGLSCVGRYSPPQLVPVVKPDPQQDFARLQKQFAAMGGKLVCSDDDVATWKDTNMFRIFELKHDTVVIFPYNWGTAVYNIIIFAGRIRPDLNPYDAILFDSVQGPNARVWNTGIDWSVSDPAILQIHFQDLHFGDSEKNVIALQTAYIRDPAYTDYGPAPYAGLRDNAIAMLTVCKGWMDAQRSNLNVRMATIDGKLAYFSIAPIGIATLDGFAIEHPNTPVVAQGTFTLSVK
jgi:hypothetical protein